MLGLGKIVSTTEFDDSLRSAKLHLRLDPVYTYFSREVAREVTQPVWPSRVPRRTNCSAMMCGRVLTLGINGGRTRWWCFQKSAGAL